MSELRKADRVRSLLSAHVIFNKGASTFDCVVKNISTIGARLEIGDAIALPNEFDLSIPHKQRTYSARIAWRGDGIVGVEFIGETARAPTPDGESEADRCDRLMHENAKLKAQVTQLRMRVAQLTGEL
jgi:hypothetical protein